VVHFCAALLVSAFFSAPWHALAPVGVATTAVGGLGVVYSLMVLRRAIMQKDYKPVLEDWIWHAALPTLAYAMLVHSGLALRHETADTIYVVGAATLLLLFIGIHNAWDAVTYLTLVLRAPGPEGSAPVAADRREARRPPRRRGTP
jgi:hypothetical protein